MELKTFALLVCFTASALGAVVLEDFSAVPTPAITTSSTTVKPEPTPAPTTVTPEPTTKKPDPAPTTAPTTKKPDPDPTTAPTTKKPDPAPTTAPTTKKPEPAPTTAPTTKIPDPTPSSTTENPTPSSSTTTTVAPPVAVGEWIVKDSNVTCLIAKMAFSLNVTYVTTKNTTETIVVSPLTMNPNGTTVNGTCGNATQAILIPLDHGMLTLEFALDSSKSSLTAIILNATDLPEFDVNKTGIYKENTAMFVTPVRMSYKCSKEQTVNLTSADNSTAVLILSDAQLQAFRDDSAINFSDETNTPPRSPEMSENIELDEDDILEEIVLDDEIIEEDNDSDEYDDEDTANVPAVREDAAVVLIGHSSSVLSCAFSPGNPAIVATGGLDDRAIVWDTSIMNNPKSLLKCELTQSLDFIKFSPNGQYLAVATLDTHVKIYDTTNYSLIFEFNEEAELSWMAWHELVPVFVTATETTVTMYNILTQASKLVCVSGHGLIQCGKVFPDGKRLAFGTESGVVQAVEMKNGKVLCTVMMKAFAGEEDAWAVTSLDVHRDGSAILCGLDGGHVCIINPDSSKHVMFPHSSGEDERVEVIEYAKTEEYKNLAASCHLNGKIRFWDTLRQAVRCEVEINARAVGMKWHPSEPIVFTCYAALRAAIMVDARSGTILRHFYGHTKMIMSVDIASDASRIMTTSDDCTARIYMLKDQPTACEMDLS